MRKAVWDLVAWALLCVLIAVCALGYRAYTFVDRVDRYYTVEKIDELHSSFVHSNDAVQISANGTSELALEFRDLVKDKARPFFDSAREEIEKTGSVVREQAGDVGSASADTIRTTDRAIATNSEAFYLNQTRIGGAALESIVTFNRRLSAEEIDHLFANLDAASHNVLVTTEDPEIRAALEQIVVDSARTVTNAANTTGNLDRTTADLDRYVNSKLFPKPPKGFWNKFKHGLKVTVEWAALGGTVFNPIVRLAR
jgi:hypothetical protein